MLHLFTNLIAEIIHAHVRTIHYLEAVGWEGS